MTDLGSQKRPQMAPKSDLKPTKNRCKKRSEQRTEIRPSWDRLGAVLGRFVTALGVIFIDFSLDFKDFREDSLFSKNTVSRAVLSPTWPILGRFWPPKRLQDGAQKRPKTIQQKKMNFDHFLHRFLIEKTPKMPQNPAPSFGARAVPPKPPSLRLRPSLQPQTLLASSKALSVIRFRVRNFA